MPFRKGRSKTGGRRKRADGGRSNNRKGELLKQTIIAAAAAEGSDGCGTDGLLGYVRRLAADAPETFTLQLMRRLLKVEAKIAAMVAVEKPYRSVDEIKAELASRAPIEVIKQLLPPS